MGWTKTAILPGGALRAGRVGVVLAVVALATVPVLGGVAYADEPPAGGPYSLVATVSPAPMSAAECAANPRCVAAAAPLGGGADDQPALAVAVATAATRAVPAVVVDGTVVTPAQPATVFLGSGTYVLAHPLSLPPNVDLRGGGITATVLLLAPDSWGNFGYNFLVRPDGGVSEASTNLVSDLTVNGSCKRGAGAPDPNVPRAAACDLGATKNFGGGVKAGDRWTVRQVRFTNLNYFKLWISGTRDAHAVDNRFDLWGGAGSGDEDNIGGGANATGTVVEYNQFDQTIRGNSIDFTNVSGVTISHNTVHAVAAYGNYGSMYLEGVTSSTVSGNVLYGAHLVLQSNSRYDHSGNNKNVTNARAVTVSGNTIIDSFQTGITVVYDDYEGDDHERSPGGANVITGNAVIRPAVSGILIISCNAGMQDAPDTVTGNTVTNAGYGGSTSFSSGCGTFDTAGIGISTGDGDLVYANSIVDDQAVPTTWYGIHIGARNGKTTPTNMVLADPAGQAPPNSVTGVVGGLYRTAAAAPEPPTLLAGTRAGAAVTLSWKEAYPMAATPVGGYRVYRDGSLVATLPVGSPTIPGNLLSEAQSNLETGIAGWTPAVGRTELSWNGTTGAIGHGSLSVRAASAGPYIGAYGPAVPVVAGAYYTSVASYSAQGTGRRVRSGVVWLDANGASLGKPLSANAATVDATGSWMTSWYYGQAPANVVSAQPYVEVEPVAANEIHLIDRIGLVAGGLTETWTDPGAPAGAHLYQVVAFRGTDGENSPVATVSVPAS